MVHPPQLCLGIGNGLQDSQNVPEWMLCAVVPCVTPLRWLVNSRRKPECCRGLGNLHPGNLSYLDVLRKYISFQKELLLKPCVTPQLHPTLPSTTFPLSWPPFGSRGTDTVPASGLCYSHALPLPPPDPLTFAKSQRESQYPKPARHPVMICRHTVCFSLRLLITTCLHIFISVFCCVSYLSFLQSFMEAGFINNLFAAVA